MAIVDGEDDLPRLPHVLAEAPFDRGQGAVGIQVVAAHVGEDADGRLESQEEPVALVDLGHEELAAAQVGVPSQPGAMRADEVARVHSGLDEDVGDHGRGRRLAVCPGNADALVPGEQGGQGVQPLHYGHFPLARRSDLDVSVVDRGGDDDGVNLVLEKARVVSDVDLRSSLPKAHCLIVLVQIRPRDARAAGQHDGGQPAHPCAPDAHEVVPLPITDHFSRLPCS